jgi:hypothetical protein
LTDILEKNEIIEKYGIKKYRVIESGEIIWEIQNLFV